MSRIRQVQAALRARLGLAGGKVVKVDRVEWRRHLRSRRQAVNALLAGEIDFIEAPPHDLLPLEKADKNVKLDDWNPIGNQYTFRFNQLHKPFDNPRCAQALPMPSTRRTSSSAVDRRSEVLQGLQGPVRLRHALRRTKPAWRACSKSNFKKAQLLKEAGYDGTPIVLMHSTDLAGADQAGAGGQVADGEGRLQGRHAVDGLADAWCRAAPRRTRRRGGWNIFLTSWVAADITNPVCTGFMNCRLRQGDVRLAVRCRDREAARRLRARDRSGQAEGRSPRRCRCATAGGRRTSRSASGISRGACARTSTACEANPVPVFWNMRRIASSSRRAWSRRRAAASAATPLAARRDPGGACAYILRRLAGDHPRDADRRGAGLPHAAPDAGRSRRDHRRRQRHLRAGGRDPQAARPRPADPQQFVIWIGKSCRAISASRSSSRSR